MLVFPNSLKAGTVVWANAAASTAWYTAANWNPSTASGAWLTGDLAQFANTGTATTAGINITTASLSIGSVEVTSARTRALTIGNSTTTAGTLTLNGSTVNSVANVIVRNASGSLLTLQDNDTGTGKIMGIVLGNTTDNIISIDGAGGITLGSSISGSSKHLTLAGSGSGTLTLSGTNNSYGGNTKISPGTTLSIGEVSSIPAKLGNGSGTLILAGGTLFRASQGTIETHLNPISLTDNSTVSGNSSSTRSLTFNTGSISLTSGKTLTIRSLVVGGVFDFRLTGGGFNWSEPIIVGQAGEGIGSLGPRNDNTVADQTYSGLISGPGRVSRNVSSSNPGGNSIISNPLNSYTGGTEIRGGFIGLGADNVLSTGKITIGSDPNPLGLYASGAARLLTNSITADIALGNSTNFQVRGSQDLTLSGGFVITNTMYLTISNSALTTFSGVITNAAAAGGIVKLGFGKLVFSGSNVYSGTTTIQAGSLLVNNSLGSGTSTGLVAVAVTATLGGTGTISGQVTNLFGSTLQPGLGGTNTATLTISNNLGLAGNALFTLNRTNAQNAAKISGLTTVRYGGTLTLTNVGDALQAGDTFVLFQSAVYSGGFTNFVLPTLSGNLAWNTNNLSVNGSMAVFDKTTTLALASSLNPSGYKDGVAFTATVAPTNATGSVIFSSPNGGFSTNALTVGTATSLAITNLPRGTNLITAIYGGDVNYLPSTNSLLQIVTNHPPVANAATYSRNALNTWKIAVTNLLLNTSDADGDAVTLDSVGTSTNGVSVSLSSGFVLYANTNLVNDEFTYTVTDGQGGTNTAVLTLSAGSGVAALISNLTVGGGNVTLSVAGIPGYLYNVQVSANLLSWSTIWTTNAPGNGQFQFVDTNPPQPSAYYRLMWSGN